MRSRSYIEYVGSGENSSPIYVKSVAGISRLVSGEVLIQPSHDRNWNTGFAPRYLTWVRVSKNGKNLLVFNYHYNQFVKGENRRGQLEVLKTQIKYAMSRYPYDAAVLVGDFNGNRREVLSQIGFNKIDTLPGINHVTGSSKVYSLRQ